MESVYLLIESGMFKEAVDELCDIEGICARAKAGPGVVHTTIAYLEKLKSENAVDSDDKVRVVHYLRWLRRSVDLINGNPSAFIVSTIFEQPKESLLIKEMERLIRKDYGLPRYGISAIHDTEDVWIRCRQLGGYDKFDNLLSILRGHTSDVNSVAVSPDGKTLFSSSSDNTVRIWDLNSGSCSAVRLFYLNRAWKEI